MANRLAKRNPDEMRFGLLTRLKQTYMVARALPAFFRERVTVERAEEEIKKALATREERFLDLSQHEIYERPSSPYLKLLRMAGCEFSDLRASVARHGIEATLEKLAGEGVYLTSSEFKGKKEIIRGRESFQVSLADFDPPVRSQGIITQSSGTNNRPMASLASLERWGRRSFSHCLFYSAHDLFSHSHAVYEAILPSGGGVRALVQHARLGIPIERWFARKMPIVDAGSRYYNLLTTYVFVAMAKVYGPGAAMPEFIESDELDRIVLWIVKSKARAKDCCVKTTVSNAVKIAQTALRMGASLGRAKFHLGGEPFTESKREVLLRVGAGAVADYAFEGGGSVAMGCANPAHLDDMHVQQDKIAVIERPEPIDAREETIRPLLCTTFHSGYAKLLFNVENGDYATFERRDCGCALERVGLTLHLHHIRSYEKFTSEGMNYFYGDLYEVFEKTLPAEFGGGPGDYQLVEEEDDRGQTRLTLRVHSDVPNLNEDALLRRLHEELAKGSRANEFGAKVWQAAGTLRIRRELPHASARGKILPLHMARRS